MKNDIYDLLNDIDNQIDTFETVDITCFVFFFLFFFFPL